ncbi:universal stress protein [Streptomyces sp. APSN-46.1]|uniref:universal stress protein n=1 Tax=Streptomyces sp. APSN-46.1 TaxID=2929049 RepID=UPI001FB51B41|nr:universal stress protein [Streptomyces sp. APSN-46.1]MCJ1676966.1 universal stress protein [Streptomyces sp. APSN-46.1]
MTSQVTVGLDGTPESTAAARWAARDAELRGARLDLVHVEEWLEHPPLPVTTTETQRAWAENLLRDTADELRREHPDLDVSTRRVGGLPSVALAHAAEDSDLLAIGSRGLGIVAGFIVGSVASATIAETERPVVLVRSADGTGHPPDGDRDSGPVVAGLDIRQPCDELLAFAFEEAAHRDALLIVVHGWTPPTILSYAPALDPDVLDEIVHGRATTLDAMLSPWRDKFPGLRVEPRAPIGQAAVQILHAASDAALVIVGRRIRRSAFGGHIGPITHAVMHHAISPVAVVAHD